MFVIRITKKIDCDNIADCNNIAFLSTHLGKILDRLCLARTRRPGRRATEVQVKRACQREVAAVSERGDHKAGRGTQVFIAVVEKRIAL